MYFSKRRGNPDVACCRRSTPSCGPATCRMRQRCAPRRPHPVGPVAAVVLRNWHLPSGGAGGEAADRALRAATVARAQSRRPRHHGQHRAAHRLCSAPCGASCAPSTTWRRPARPDRRWSQPASPKRCSPPPPGLLVAVPAVLLYNHFTRKITVMLTVAENHARELRIAIDEARNTPAPQPSRAGAPVAEAVVAR